MFAKRLPVLTAFAGGCLCTAALLGFVGGGPEARTPPASERHASVLPLAPPADVEPEPAPAIQPGPPRPPSHDDDDDGASDASGSSVADVLSRLEAAYQKVASASAVTPASVTAVAVEPLPEPTAATIVVPPSAATSDAPEPAPASTTATNAPSAVAAPEPPPAALEPPPAANPAPPTTAVAAAPTPPVESAQLTYVAELNQNVHVGDVHYGDRYQLEQRAQLEQLAMIQYLQLLALSSYTGAPQTRVLPKHAHRPRPSRRSAPITVIPNPDNPWGFNFPPPNLVK